MTHYSLKDIRLAYIQKKNWEKQFPLNYFFVRPISFYITYLTLKATQDPGKIAIFGFLLGALGCFSFTLIFFCTIWPGLVLISLYSLSDAVDGNVARTTQNVTLFGKYLDGVLGDIIEGIYPFSLAIGLYLSGNAMNSDLVVALVKEHAKVLPLLLGALILICRLWSKLFERGYDHYRIQKLGFTPVAKTNLQKTIEKSKYSHQWYYLLFINLDSLNNQLLLLTIFILLKLEIWFLFVFATFYFFKAVLFFIFYFNKTRSLFL
jgi:phosphatidylglycerophosphate synthase